MKEIYNTAYNIKVEAWVLEEDQPMFDPDKQKFRANVRFPDGSVEWEWFATYIEAVDYCNRFLLAKPAK